MNDRLYRSRDDRMLAGVAGGLAELWDADPSLIRIVWALLIVFTGGIALVVYIVMAIVVPEEDDVPWDARVAPPAPAAPPAAPGVASDPGATPSNAAQALVAAPPPAEAAPGAIAGWAPPSAAAARQAARDQRRAERRAAQAARGDRGGPDAALVIGALLVLVGVVFLLREFLPSIDFDVLWPLILVGLGLVLVVAALGRNRGSDGGRGTGESGTTSAPGTTSGSGATSGSGTTSATGTGGESGTFGGDA